MRIETHRFGTVDVDPADVVRIPAGLVGLPAEETSFVLLRRHATSAVGWLQSTTTPGLALPVAAVEALAFAYPEPTMLEIRGAGLQPGLLAVMAVVCANGFAPATVNLVAPIVVNVESREGAQIVRDLRGWSTRQPFVLRREHDELRAEDEVGAFIHAEEDDLDLARTAP